MESLAEFAETTPARPVRCHVCRNVPQVDEVNEGLRSGIGAAVIQRWLVSKGVEVTRSNIDYHKSRGHHDE